MTYLETIKTAILVFPLIAFLFTLPFILHEYHKYGSISPFKTLIIYSFILYMITVYFLVILPLPKIEEVVLKENMIRLIPFGFISDIARETSFVLNNPSTYLQALTDSCVYTVLFNVLMTIPFGMYLRYYFKCNLKQTFFYSFLLSLFFEVTQITGLYFIYPHPYRVFDVDDLLTNTLGGILGFYLMGFLDNHLPTRDDLDRNARKVGMQVSGLRRITLFFLDFSLYAFFSLFLSLFFSYKKLYILIFLIYYVFIPLLHKGKTLGGSFLNVALVFPKGKFFRLFFRIIFLYFYYFAFPFWLFFGIFRLINHFQFTTMLNVYLLLGICFFVGMFYLFNGIILVSKKEIFYNKWFKVTYKSTIEEEGENEEER